MTRALPGARLPGAFAASLAIHAALAAGLLAVAGGPMSAGLPALKPEGLLATLRPVQPAETSTRSKSTNQNGAGGSATLPKPYYHPASELTERPQPLAAIVPSFPDGAPPTGRVKLNLYINERGAVDAVDITEAEPAGEFEQATVQAFSEARFRPGYKDGIPVRSQLALEVRFGEPLPMPAHQRDVAALALPENPNAYDAPDRIGIKTRRAR